MSRKYDDPAEVRRHIFHTTYLYAIPGYYRYSKEYNEKVGHLHTGSKELNQRYMTEYVNIGGTIADILKLYKQGADIKFQNPREDLVTIYEVISAHLGFWADYVNNDPNVKDAPLDSLYLMSDFAQTIKDQVVGFKPDIKDVPELRRVSSLFGNLPGAHELFNTSAVGVDVQETSPLMDRIERLLAERNKRH
jgi:hypothetical protein